MPYMLAIAVGAFALGIAVESVYPITWPLIALTALLGAILIFFARTAMILIAGIALLTCTFGAGRVMLAPQAPPEAFLQFFDTEITWRGTVRGDPDVREATQRVTVETEEGADRMRVLVVASLHPPVEHEDQVLVTGTLAYPEPFATDGGRIFRYDDFLAKDGVFGIVEYAELEVVGEPSAFDSLHRILYLLKHEFTRGLEHAFPEPYAALAAGIITGGKQGLGNELLDAFVTAGLIHIVVLSGYNVMIVAEAVLRALGFLRKKAATAVAGVVIALFVLAAGAGAASLRAGAMAGVALFARASGRTYDALRALLLVFVVMLLAHPLLLVHDPGFQFSFAATLGLILAAPTIEARLEWLRPAFLRDITATTLAAQLFVLPLLLYQTGNLSLAALPANMLALPIVPLTMLLSAIAGALGVAAPSIAPMVSVPALMLLAYLVELAQFVAALPGASTVVPAFPFYVVPALYAVLFGLLYRARAR